MTELFTDEEGRYGDPGQEYIFHPGKDREKQEETQEKTKTTQETTEENQENKNNTKQAGLPTKTSEKEEQEILFKGKNA